MGRFGGRVGVVEALAFATGVQLLLAAAILLVARHGTGRLGTAFSAPPWMWIGGLMGLIVVFSITFAQPRIGATATIGILIAGQLVMGAVIDRYGLFGVDQIALTWPRLARDRPARRRSGALARAVSHGAKVWTALWAVYIIWGSTYLFIAIAVETIPPMLAVSTRFIAASAIMAAIVVARGGTLRAPRTRAPLLRPRRRPCCPGANAVLFYAEQDVPTGLASLIIASVPLWVVLIRLGLRERQSRAVLVGVGDRLRRRRGAAPARGRRRPRSGSGSACVSAVMWAVGSVASARLPMPSNPFAATTWEMLCGRPADAPVRARADGLALDLGRVGARVGLPRHDRLGGRVHGVHLAARQGAARASSRPTRT